MPLVIYGRRGSQLGVLRTECGLSAALDTGPDDENSASHPGERAGCTGRRIGPVMGIGQECRLRRTRSAHDWVGIDGGTVRLTGGPRLVLGATGPHEEGTVSRVVPGVKSTARHRDSASQRRRQQGHTACPIAAHSGRSRSGVVRDRRTSRVRFTRDAYEDGAYGPDG